MLFPALIEMERQDEIELFRIEAFWRARKGRRQANRAKGEPVKLCIAAGLRERESAQGAIRTDGKINQRLAFKMEARRASGGNPFPQPPKIGRTRSAER